jgi:hypothetical protein
MNPSLSLIPYFNNAILHHSPKSISLDFESFSYGWRIFWFSISVHLSDIDGKTLAEGKLQRQALTYTSDIRVGTPVVRFLE